MNDKLKNTENSIITNNNMNIEKIKSIVDSNEISNEIKLLLIGEVIQLNLLSKEGVIKRVVANI